MLIDGRKVATGSKVSGDVAIIGAGPASLAIAQELEAINLNVVILEAGSTETMDVTESGKHPGPGGFLYDLETNRARGIGGSSGRWFDIGWQARPMEAVDFEHRDCIPESGWPIQYPSLLPYFEKAQKICHLGPLEYESDFWMQWEKRRPSFWLSTETIKTSIMQIGDPKVFVKQKDNLKTSQVIKVYINSRVTQIEATENKNKITRLNVKTDAGNTFQVEAQTYVLATGGIDNARLLLASNLGNQHDVVGRYFMEHIHVNTGCIRLFDTQPLDYHEFYEPHYSGLNPYKVKGVLKLKEDSIRSKQLGNCLLWMYAMPEDYLRDSIHSFLELRRYHARKITVPGKIKVAHGINILKDSPKLISLAAQRMMGSRLPKRSFKIVAEAEQIPNFDSRVKLGDTVDSFGMPTAKLEWKLTDFDTYSIRKTQESLDAELRRLNIGCVEGMLGEEWPTAKLAGGAHHMGTTRMHNSPTLGVVDSNSKVHNVANLYVAGSSVFTTGGSSNPTITLLALAFRLADHLKLDFKHM